MNPGQSLQNKILNRSDLLARVQQWRQQGHSIVFTNGCFDILHAGHIASLEQAAMQGNKLIVALNTDDSVRKLKGPLRPLNDQEGRARVVSALAMVDAVTLFAEETPRDLIVALLPDVLVKGGDYTVEQIAGAREVLAAGGRVVINPIVQGYSTTSLINKMKTSG